MFRETGGNFSRRLSGMENRDSVAFSLLFRFSLKGAKYKMLCYPLDIHKMSGVLFAEAWVFGKGSSPRAKAGRGDHPGVKLGPRFFDDSSFWFGQVSASGSEFGVGLSARFAREKLQTGPRRATFACEGVAVGPTKSSPRRWHQRCSFPSQCGTPAREVARPSCRSG